MVREYIIKVDDEKKDVMGGMPLMGEPKELIRCKNCKHSVIRMRRSLHPASCGLGRYCPIISAWVTEEDFCMNGKREGDGE